MKKISIIVLLVFFTILNSNFSYADYMDYYKNQTKVGEVGDDGEKVLSRETEGEFVKTLFERKEEDGSISHPYSAIYLWELEEYDKLTKNNSWVVKGARSKYDKENKRSVIKEYKDLNNKWVPIEDEIIVRGNMDIEKLLAHYYVIKKKYPERISEIPQDKLNNRSLKFTDDCRPKYIRESLAESHTAVKESYAILQSEIQSRAYAELKNETVEQETIESEMLNKRLDEKIENEVVEISDGKNVEINKNDIKPAIYSGSENDKYKIYYYAEHTKSIFHKLEGYYTELYTIHINDDYNFSNKYNKDIFCTEGYLDEIGKEGSNVYELTQVMNNLVLYNIKSNDGYPHEHRYQSIVVDKHIKVHNNKNKWFSLFGDENYGHNGFIDLRNLDTSSLTSTEGMFYNVQVGSINLENINLSNVTNMSYMFGDEELGSGSAYITKINFKGVDTSNVTNMRSMFNGLTNIKDLDLSGFNTSKVTDMNSMFVSMFSIEELDLSSFDTRNVTNMVCMFACCNKLETICVSDKFKVNYESNPRNFDGMFMDTDKIVGGNGSTKSLMGYWSDGDSGSWIDSEKIQNFLKNRSYNEQSMDCSFLFANIDTESNPGFFTNIKDKGKKKVRKKDTDNTNPKNTGDNDDIKETDNFDPSLNGWVGDSLYNNGVKVKNEWILNKEGLHHIGADGKLDRSKWVEGNYIDENGVVVKEKESEITTETKLETVFISRNMRDYSFGTYTGNYKMISKKEGSKGSDYEITYDNGVIGYWMSEPYGILKEDIGDKTIIKYSDGQEYIYYTSDLKMVGALMKEGIFLGSFDYKSIDAGNGNIIITEVCFKETMDRTLPKAIELQENEYIIVPQYKYPRLYIHMYLANRFYPDGNIDNEWVKDNIYFCE